MQQGVDGHRDLAAAAASVQRAVWLGARMAESTKTAVNRGAASVRSTDGAAEYCRRDSRGIGRRVVATQIDATRTPERVPAMARRTPVLFGSLGCPGMFTWDFQNTIRLDRLRATTVAPY